MNVPPPPTEQRVPRTDGKVGKRAAEARAEAVAPKLASLAEKFGPRHAPKPPKEKKEIVPFDPFAPRQVTGTVNWSAQDKARNQQRTAGKRKNQSGKKS